MKEIKKNICITINSLSRGGAEKQCLLLARALKPYHNVTVLILNPEPIYPPRQLFIEEEGLQHRFLSKNPIKKFLGFIRFLKNNQTDIIFSFLPTDTIVSAICGKIAGVSLIFGGIRNSYMPKAKFIALKWANNYLLNYTIANNFAAYHAALEQGFKKSVFVISNGIDVIPLVKKSKEEIKSISIISLGRLVAQKEYGTALKVIANLKEILDARYSITYTIVGEGPEKDNITKDIEILGLENEVTIVTNASDIYGMLGTADIYLCSSSFEGVSNAIMEAMNCGLPIVATNAGDNARLVVDTTNGFIAPIHDTTALAECLKKLIQSPELRFKMGIASHTHLTTYFSYQTFQENYLKLIENSNAMQIANGEVYSGKTNVS